MEAYHTLLWWWRCKIPSDLFPALERPEGVSQQDYTDVEEFQQRINAVSLEKVKAYYRRLRYTMLRGFTAPHFNIKGVHVVLLHKQAECAHLISFFRVFNLTRCKLDHLFSPVIKKKKSIKRILVTYFVKPNKWHVGSGEPYTPNLKSQTLEAYELYLSWFFKICLFLKPV